MQGAGISKNAYEEEENLGWDRPKDTATRIENVGLEATSQNFQQKPSSERTKITEINENTNSGIGNKDCLKNPEFENLNSQKKIKNMKEEPWNFSDQAVEA
ncbi:hypothetical protein AAC387_Pa01g0978 [Persea americana]